MIIKPKICLIAAMDETMAIGRDGDLLWKISEDMKFFRDKTRGNVVIMGRKTLESLPNGKPLPDRPNIVISRGEPLYQHPLLTWTDNVASALDLGMKMAIEKNQPEIFVIGGGQIYKDTLAVADRMYLTLIQAKADGDAFFPTFNERDWSRDLVKETDPAGDTPAFKIYQYDRLQAA